MKTKLLNLNLILALILTIHTGLSAQNPLLERFNTPHGIIPFEKVELDHILPAFHAALEENRQQVQAIIDNPQPATFENTIAAYARSGHKRALIGMYVRGMGITYTNAELNRIVAEVSQLNTGFFNETLFNTKLFERVKAVYDQRESLMLSQEEQSLLEHYYRWFARNGNELSDTEKERLKEIRNRLAELRVIFGQNVTQDRDRTFFHLAQLAEMQAQYDNERLQRE